ncbi:hypothetical protein GCM10009738_78970 [Kitasatospora viridis]|uniref:hypothetical protein n=1 Tax=Kitasatospora viridis TaxID=281105 RepID=UPI0031D01CA9
MADAPDLIQGELDGSGETGPSTGPDALEPAESDTMVRLRAAVQQLNNDRLLIRPPKNP